LQDAERRRLGRDLHDSTGQVLAALEINLARLQRRSADPDPEARRLLDESVSLAKRSLDEIRTASYLLHPPLLDELGLATALRWLADGFRARSDIQLHLVVPERMDRLPAEIELALFRVAQEALTNVYRHSGARSAEMRLNSDAETVTLCISDTGHGLGAGAVGAGVGLAAMRERMQQIGGELGLISGITGTSITARRRLDSASGSHETLRPPTD
jgi:signal transduction histidine kinase